MFLRAGALSLALLVASRLLGLLRETAQAAAFGASGLADVAVLMLTLPDWLAGVLASGALAYVMLPAWARQADAQVAASQRRLALWLLGGGIAFALLLAWRREEAIDLLAPGLGVSLHAAAAQAITWAAAALPLALLAALWATRLQHEREFVGMYGSNLVVNGVLVVALLALAFAGTVGAGGLVFLAWGLAGAMVARLAWLAWRLPRTERAADADLPSVPTWLWAALAAGLPLALPFAARSIASASGEGALATFNYAWKLVELPLMLAVQLVATLAFPAITRAFAEGEDAPAAAVRPAMALAWTLACAAAAGLLLAAPALAQLLFGWGRMDAGALIKVADWGRIAAWGLLPQALIAVALTVLATQRRMQWAVGAYAAALALLLFGAAQGVTDGARLMAWLNGILAMVAIVLLLALGRIATRSLPWSALAVAFAALVACAAASRLGALAQAHAAVQIGAAVLAAALVLAATAASSADLRAALRR
jgi:putative peptidoglycan lipid II flippase